MIVNVLFCTFVLLFDLMVPLVMIGFGKSFMKNPPTEINPGFGYRTTMSTKNKMTWDFAQRYAGKVWYKISRIMLPLSILPLLFVIGKEVETVGTVGFWVGMAQVAVMLGTIPVVEHALKKNFDKNGRRKTETD